MKDPVYNLLNEIDHQPESYAQFEASPADVQKWKKSMSKSKPKSGQSWIKYTAAAACICLIAAVAGPAGQTVYAQVNAFLYSLSDLLGISKDLSPYSTVIGESISKDGITVTLNDVILDDETLLVSYTTTSAEPLTDEADDASHPELSGIYINGQQMAAGAGGSMEKKDEHTIVSCMTIEMPDIDPAKQMDMELRFSQSNSAFGSFSFTASGKELQADTATIKLDQTFTLPDQSQLTLTRYTASDVNQKIYFESSLDEYVYDLMLKGCDDLGNDVEFVVRFFRKGEGRMEVNTIDNGYINENAKELTLTLYAVKMPETSGKMSSDYEPVGEPFMIPLSTDH